jgi:hypothetical protein
MSNRHSDREHWEVLMMTLFLAFRGLLFIFGCLFLIYGGAIWAVFPVAALLAIGLATLLFGMVLSDRITLYVANFLAWLLTVQVNKN